MSCPRGRGGRDARAVRRDAGVVDVHAAPLEHAGLRRAPRAAAARGSRPPSVGRHPAERRHASASRRERAPERGRGVARDVGRRRRDRIAAERGRGRRPGPRRPRRRRDEHRRRSSGLGRDPRASVVRRRTRTDRRPGGPVTSPGPRRFGVASSRAREARTCGVIAVRHPAHLDKPARAGLSLSEHPAHLDKPARAGLSLSEHPAHLDKPARAGLSRPGRSVLPGPGRARGPPLPVQRGASSVRATGVSARRAPAPCEPGRRWCRSRQRPREWSAPPRSTATSCRAARGRRARRSRPASRCGCCRAAGGP